MDRPVVVIKEDDATVPNLTVVVPLTTQIHRREPSVTVDIPARRG